MKKYLLILLFLLSPIPAVHAQTVQHQAKTPSFFVPKGAFESNTKQQRVAAQPTVVPAKKQVIVGKPQVTVKANAQPQIAPAKIKPQKQVNAPTPVYRENAQPKKLTSAAPQPTKAAPTIPEVQISPFQVIMAEYVRDTELLAKGQSLNNPRLKNVLADFKNQEHRL